MSEPVLLSREGAICTLTLNRPKALNALNDTMLDHLSQRLEELERDETLRAVVLRGAGDHFMAGGDVKMFYRSLENDRASRESSYDGFLDRIHAVIKRLHHLHPPVIASVRGAVAGVGVSLLGLADLAIASEESFFNLAYCNIGLCPDGGSTYMLPRLTGLKKAKEVAFLGERFDASTARDIGLVNWVVPDATLDEETHKIAARLAEGPTYALARTKALLNASSVSGFDDQLDAERASFAACTTTGDFEEGVRAFVEKRKPSFRGH